MAKVGWFDLEVATAYQSQEGLAAAASLVQDQG